MFPSLVCNLSYIMTRDGPIYAAPQYRIPAMHAAKTCAQRAEIRLRKNWMLPRKPPSRPLSCVGQIVSQDAVEAANFLEQSVALSQPSLGKTRSASATSTTPAGWPIRAIFDPLARQTCPATGHAYHGHQFVHVNSQLGDWPGISSTHRCATARPACLTFATKAPANPACRARAMPG